MKAKALVATLLVIVSLAAPAAAYEQEVPHPVPGTPDPGQTAEQAIRDAEATSERIVDEYGPDQGNDGEGGRGAEHPAPVPGTPATDQPFCGRLALPHEDCAEQPAPDAGEAPAQETPEPTNWIPILLGEPHPQVPAPEAPDAEETARGLVGALGALLEPVQQAGEVAKRAVADTVQTVGLVLDQATALAERQVQELVRQVGHLGDKFFDIVGGAGVKNIDSDARSSALQTESVATAPGPVAAASLTMAAVGGIGLLVGAFAILRRLIGLGGMSLLSRIPSKDIMKNDTRAAIFDIVQHDPGVSLNEIVSRLGISRNAVAYHLAVFESEHSVVSVKDGKYRRYFVNGGKYVNGAKDVVSTIKNDVTLKVIRHILDHPGAIQKDVCKAVGTSPSATNWHITRLEKVGLVSKQKVANTVRYTPGPSLDKYDLGEFGLSMPQPAPAPA